jgi:hypothetical protein
MPSLSAREAADVLESTPNLSQLRVAVLHLGYSDEHGAVDASRFVAALHNHSKVRSISFVGYSGFVAEWGRTDGERAARAHEFERLFGSVLPRPASLRNVSFSLSLVPAPYLRRMMMMASAIDPLPAPSTSSSLRQLSLYDCVLDPHGEAGRVIGDALGSRGDNNASPLTDVRVARCGLSSDDCRLILDGASDSRQLVSLSVDEPTELLVEARTLERILANSSSSSSSPLRTLRVGAKEWTRDGIEAALRLLRTNVHLETLDVSGTNANLLHGKLCSDVLSTYNFSLRYVPCGGAEPEQQAEMDRLLDLNVRVRHDYDRLVEDKMPRVGSRVVLCAEAFARVSRFPTLLHRLLRRGGHGIALAEQCLPQHPPSHNRRRKRKLATDAATIDDGRPAVRRSRRV